MSYDEKRFFEYRENLMGAYALMDVALHNKLLPAAYPDGYPGSISYYSERHVALSRLLGVNPSRLADACYTNEATKAKLKKLAGPNGLFYLQMMKAQKHEP